MESVFNEQIVQFRQASSVRYLLTLHGEEDLVVDLGLGVDLALVQPVVREAAVLYGQVPVASRQQRPRYLPT